MFDRLELLIGDKINILKEKTILLLGLGGVGGHCFESLIRSGISNIIVVDSDDFEITNLNRQVLATQTTLGTSKVDAAVERKNEINPNCNIIPIKKFIDENNINILFEEKIDFVIDAIDTVKTKEAVIKECLKRNIPLISIMGTGGKMDASKLMITKLSKTSYDKLAKKIRTDLRKEHLTDKVTVVSSIEKPKITSPIGTNAFVPAIAGLLATNYVVNELIKENKNE